MHRQVFFQNRMTRWILGLLGGFLLLVGLILNVRAEAPVNVELSSSGIHTYRPLFFNQSGIAGRLHPVVKPGITAAFVSKINPGAWGNRGGLFCINCHPGIQVVSNDFQGSSILSRFHFQQAFEPDLSCDSCHRQPFAQAY